MIGRRTFIQGLGSAFLCLNLGLKLGAEPVSRRWEAVRDSGVRPGHYMVTIGDDGAGDGFGVGHVTVPRDAVSLGVRCIGGGGGGGQSQ